MPILSLFSMDADLQRLPPLFDCLVNDTVLYQPTYLPVVASIPLDHECTCKHIPVIVPRFHNSLGLGQDSWMSRSGILWSWASVGSLSSWSVSRARCTGGAPSCCKVNKPIDIWSFTHDSAGLKINKFYQPWLELQQNSAWIVFVTAIATLHVGQWNFWKPVFYKVV